MYSNIPEIDGVPQNPEALQLFEELAPTLTTFASRHSLLVRKYYHKEPMWSFHFLHPKGGFAMVQIDAHRLNAESFSGSVASNWWVDDHEKCLRSLMSTKPERFVASQPDDVLPALEGALIYLLAQTQAALTRTSQAMPRRRDKGGNFVFSDFERAQRLPT
jgi:hypothetical protein